MSLRSLVSLLSLALLLAACGGDDAVSVKLAHEQPVYADGDVQLNGFMAYDANRKGKRPGILVVHEWWGLQDHPRERAERLAQLGYVALCVDMYGDGKTTDDPKVAGKLAGAFYGDRAGHGRARLKAAYDLLAQHPRVDKAKIGVMGFCYGGSVALESAWAGWDVKGVVCFHGNLTTPSEEDAKNVKAAVLVCNGAADAWVPPEMVQGFSEAMEKAGITFNVKSYEGAVHAFTNPGASERGMDNVAYHKAADEQSWKDMVAFWKQHLGE